MYTEALRNEIKEQVIKVLEYSQELNDITVDDLMNKWNTNKAHIADWYFRDSPIYQYPEKVRFELDQEGKANRYSSFKDYICDRCDYEIEDELSDYLDTITVDEFFNNIVDRNYQLNDEVTINKGMKFVKSLKYFISDKEILNDVQNTASEFIQENKIEGYLCLSIHPLDYLSSSETNYKWRSCHSLDGEYRAGNLSYMADRSTVVCYLKSEEDVVLPRFPDSVKWNNKKWRCLLFFNDTLSLIFAGRQYPFYSVNALDKIRDIFMHEMAHIFPFSNWHNDYLEFKQYENGDFAFLSGKYFIANGRIYDINTIVKDGENSCHYNDLLHSHSYTHPYYMFKEFYTDKDTKPFHIGEAVKCLCCGENSIVPYNDIMLCKECLDPNCTNCDHCGYTYEDEDIIEIEGYHLCQECYDKLKVVCDNCNETVINHKTIEEKIYCLDCWEEIEDGERHTSEETDN